MHALSLLETPVLAQDDEAVAQTLYLAAKLRCCSVEDFADWYSAAVVASRVNKDKIDAETFCRDADPRSCLEARKTHCCVRPGFQGWTAITVSTDDQPTPVMLRWARRHRIPLRQWVMRSPWWQRDEQGHLF